MEQWWISIDFDGFLWIDLPMKSIQKCYALLILIHVHGLLVGLWLWIVGGFRCWLLAFFVCVGVFHIFLQYICIYTKKIGSLECSKVLAALLHLVILWYYKKPCNGHMAIVYYYYLANIITISVLFLVVYYYKELLLLYYYYYSVPLLFSKHYII